jgi:TolA-binding protein
MHRMRDLNLGLQIADCRLQILKKRFLAIGRAPWNLSSARGTMVRWRLLAVLVLLFFLAPVSNLPAQQLTADQQAEMMINSARQAFNDKNFTFAVTRFREFLAKFPNHKDAASAHYGLALGLLELPDADYAGAAEQLQPLAGNKAFAEHALVLYHLGLARRGLGTKELAQAIAKPQAAAQLRASANQHFEEAAKLFAAAQDAFTARAKDKPNSKELPIDLEWAARARCDQAEMLLRVLKAKEAQALTAPFVKDPLWTKSRYCGLGRYYHGYAGFLLKDYLAAGRALNLLAPFNDPVFGTHARYLLARVHHLSEELPEAAGHYEGVLADYEANKKAAAEALKQPDQFKNDPAAKTRLEALVKEPPPDHVARASFFLGVLLYEGGRFADALARFAALESQYPRSALLPEGQLRIGFCQVQLRQFAEAIQKLQPLVDKEPRLADQALFWIGKAQIGAADPANAPVYSQALKTAIETFRRAADKAQQLSGADPEAKTRRGEILLELADTQQLGKQFKEAAATYAQILGEKILPQREEEVMQRQAAALHLAGDYAASDQVCVQFQKAYPKSSLLAAVLFRQAENAHFLALAAEKNKNLPERDKLNDEAARRYQAIVDKYPDFPFAGLARYGLAMTYYRKGDLEKTKEVLEAIPAGERTGELAQVPYLLADCHLRLAPTKVDDALSAGRAQEELKSAVELLDGFCNAQPAGSQTPDALLKLGHCYQRLAALIAEPQERGQLLTNARAAYEKLINQFPKHPLQGQAVFERAKCLAQSGDVGGAMNELQRFNQDPLKAAPGAPMALLRLATLLRGQNRAGDAANVLAQCRQQHEANLLKDPARAGWVPVLQYHQGAAFQEAGKSAEARGVFDGLIKQFPDLPESAEAACRRAQCLKQDGKQKVEAARKRLATPNLKPPEIAAAQKDVNDSLKTIGDAVQSLIERAEQLKQKQPSWEARARILYEAAWGYRLMTEIPETQGKDELQKKTRDTYQALIDGFPDLALANEARFELAELQAQRGDNDSAVKLLTAALEKEPAADLADKIRLRLGACYAAKKDAKSALAQFDAVANNPKSPLMAQAHYRAGEALMELGDFTKAAGRFAAFRDQPPLQNVGGLTDRALLRLGHAYGNLKQWDQSRQAHELLIARFGNSPWVHEARYGIGWAWQNQKQYDQAINVYNQVISATAAEIAAKAQLNIGLCRLEQKQYLEAANAFLAVYSTYDYPETNAVALTEAARAYTELKQHDQAIKLLNRVIKDHPKSKWSEVAKERLEALQKG